MHFSCHLKQNKSIAHWTTDHATYLCWKPAQ